jgi:hypothetical protein
MDQVNVQMGTPNALRSLSDVMRLLSTLENQSDMYQLDDDYVDLTVSL